MPESRRGNKHAKSNWLHGQALGRIDISRLDSIAAIDKVPATDETGNIRQVIQLMQHPDDRDYCWNFSNIIGGKGTIEFRKPPASTTSDEALDWAELAMCFIQAAVRYGDRARLEKVPSIVGGLRWFLEQAHVPGMNEPERLARVFDQPDSAALEPQFVAEDSWNVEPLSRERVTSKVAKDKRRVLATAKSLQTPYWR